MKSIVVIIIFIRALGIVAIEMAEGYPPGWGTEWADLEKMVKTMEGISFFMCKLENLTF